MRLGLFQFEGRINMIEEQIEFVNSIKAEIDIDLYANPYNDNGYFDD